MNEVLVNDFILLLMIFIRIVSALSVAPVYSNGAVDVKVRVLFALVLAYVMFMSLDRTIYEVHPNFGWMILNGIKEVLTGMLLGFMVNFVFYGVSFAASIISMNVGLNMAQAFNPMDEVSDNIIGEIYGFITVLVFFVINGHHYLITGLLYSFKIINIGQFKISQPTFNLIVQYAFSVFVIAIKIAAPIMVALFVVQIAEGIVARMIPQMQIFFVTQPLKIAFGIFLMIASLPITVYFIKVLLKDIEGNLLTLIKSIG